MPMNPRPPGSSGRILGCGTRPVPTGWIGDRMGPMGFAAPLAVAIATGRLDAGRQWMSDRFESGPPRPYVPPVIAQINSDSLSHEAVCTSRSSR